MWAGIDPGVKTGVAIWNSFEQEFYEIKTCTMTEAQILVLYYYDIYKDKGGFACRIEDARLRKFWPKGVGRLQGVGSVKRSSQMWEEFCQVHDIPHMLRAPSSTKMNAKMFARLTGWTGRTSEHARDAAVSVFGMKPNFNRKHLK